MDRYRGERVDRRDQVNPLTGELVEKVTGRDRTQEREDLARSLVRELREGQDVEINVESACLSWGLPASDAKAVCKRIFAMEPRADYTGGTESCTEVALSEEGMSDD